MLLGFLRQNPLSSSSLDEWLSTQDSKSLKSEEHVELKHYLNGKQISTEVILLSQASALEGKAETDIGSEALGRVSYQGTTWKARCCSSKKIFKGQKVLVLKRQGLTLWIIPK